MKEYWITNDRFKLIVIVLLLMWIGFMAFFYLKAEEITKNPCQVCARQMGTDVSCSLYDGSGTIKIFHKDYSVDLVTHNLSLYNG